MGPCSSSDEGSTTQSSLDSILHNISNPLSFLESLPSFLDLSPTTVAPAVATEKPNESVNEKQNSDLLDDPILLEFADNSADDSDYFEAVTPPDRFTRAILRSGGSVNDVVGGGKPGQDFPALNKIPRTGFSCQGKIPGYYADETTHCQVWSSIYILITISQWLIL